MALINTLSDEPPLGKFIEKIVVGLADEGIPIRAIARAVGHPSDPVRRAVHNAFSAGNIVQIPRDDWPPGTRREDRLPDMVTLGADDDMMIMACSRAFKVTRLQARLLTVLIRRPEATKRMLHQVVEQERDPTKETTDLKIVDVVICNLRKRLKAYNLEIKTIWSSGYFMEPEHRKKAEAMLKERQALDTSGEKPVKI